MSLAYGSLHPGSMHLRGYSWVCRKQPSALSRKHPSSPAPESLAQIAWGVYPAKMALDVHCRSLLLTLAFVADAEYYCESILHRQPHMANASHNPPARVDNGRQMLLLTRWIPACDQDDNLPVELCRIE